jgi:SAM-dependent methyltransferase
MRTAPAYHDLVRDAYLGRDVVESADRFFASPEFAEVLRLTGPVAGKTVIDLGAGTGIASCALARSGARQVYAVEPDPSDEVGRGAIERIRAGCESGDIAIVDAYGDRIPLPDGTADLIYGRQVLHHVQDLPATMRELYRLLKPGGQLVMCREHIADSAQQLQEFLGRHPMHQLAGGENAYPLPVYTAAITGAGFRLTSVLGPWDSLINAFPFVGSADELAAYPRMKLRHRLGASGTWVARIPGVEALLWRWIRRPTPGRMYTFIAYR